MPHVPQKTLAPFDIIWVIWGTMSEPRINCRPPADLMGVVERVAARDFGGNKSQLVMAYLRERFEVDGEMESMPEEPDLVDALELLHEMRSRGVTSERINEVLLKLYEKEVA